MSYEPKTWNCGDTITAEDLNHIEQGIANSGGGTSEPLMVMLTEQPSVINPSKFLLSLDGQPFDAFSPDVVYVVNIENTDGGNTTTQKYYETAVNSLPNGVSLEFTSFVGGVVQAVSYTMDADGTFYRYAFS